MKIILWAIKFTHEDRSNPSSRRSSSFPAVVSHGRVGLEAGRRLLVSVRVQELCLRRWTGAAGRSPDWTSRRGRARRLILVSPDSNSWCLGVQKFRLALHVYLTTRLWNLALEPCWLGLFPCPSVCSLRLEAGAGGVERPGRAVAAGFRDGALAGTACDPAGLTCTRASWGRSSPGG